MIPLNKEVFIVNRSDGSIGYTIPDLGNRTNVHRDFVPRQTKKVTFEELEALMNVPGGEYLIRNFIIIKDEEVLNELLPDVQPEYFYTEKEVEQLLQTGSLDEFLDCLDFAPQGVLDMIKDKAVNLPVTDTEKIRAIQKKMNFDVGAAIAIKEVSKDDAESDKEEKKRRVATKTEKKVVRRAEPIKTVPAAAK